MSIVQMKKLRLIALNEQRDDLLASLLRVGCVEVQEPEAELSDPEWAGLVHKDDSDLMEVRARANSLTAALDALKKYAPPKFSLFEVRHDVTEEEFFDDEKLADTMAVVDTINGLTKEIAQTYSTENRLAAQKTSVLPWMAIDWPLEAESTDATDVTFGIVPAKTDLEAMTEDFASHIEEAEFTKVSQDKDSIYLMMVSYKESTDAAQEFLRNYGFSALHFKDCAGTAAQTAASLDERIQELKDERAGLEEQVKTFADRRADIKLCLDRMNQEVAKQAAREKFLTNGTVLFMEGWVRADGLEKLEKELEPYCCAYDLEDPTDDDDVPVVLKNSPMIDPAHMVVEMYSLPDYKSIDPNPLFYPFFVFYFGFMFADIGYGIIIFLVSYFITKKYHPKGTMGYMFKLGQQIGVMTTIVGFFVGSFFGDAITVFSENFLGKANVALWALVNPMQEPMKILIFGIVLGCLQMIFGMCIKIYLGWKQGNLKEALLDVVPWWIFFIGLGLTVMTGMPVWVILGCVALVATQGRNKETLIGKILGGVVSLYDVTSWLGDVLSYSRLMALMLATTVIASVVNILGTLPHNILLFFVIFIIGHIFNIGINIIGTYIHAARLQYLEFFGKFYQDGGRPFKPLAFNTKYVDVVEETAAKE